MQLGGVFTVSQFTVRFSRDGVSKPARGVLIFINIYKFIYNYKEVFIALGGGEGLIFKL